VRPSNRDLAQTSPSFGDLAGVSSAGLLRMGRVVHILKPSNPARQAFPTALNRRIHPQYSANSDLCVNNRLHPLPRAVGVNGRIAVPSTAVLPTHLQLSHQHNGATSPDTSRRGSRHSSTRRIGKPQAMAFNSRRGRAKGYCPKRRCTNRTEAGAMAWFRVRALEQAAVCHVLRRSVRAFLCSEVRLHPRWLP